MSKRESDKNSKANMQAQMQAQNVDTGLPVFTTDDIRPYEQQNMPKGASKKNTGRK